MPSPSPPFGLGGRHIRLRERGWGVPIPTRGHTLWCSINISTLFSRLCTEALYETGNYQRFGCKAVNEGRLHCTSTYCTPQNMKNLDYNSVCTLSELGPPHPLFLQRVCPPPPNQRGRGHTRLRVRGWGVPTRLLEKKPSTLSILWLYKVNTGAFHFILYKRKHT